MGPGWFALGGDAGKGVRRPAIAMGRVEAATTEQGDPSLYFNGQYGTFTPT